VAATVRRLVRVLLAGGGIVLALGLALTAWRVIAYLEAGRAVSSTSGLIVFRVADELVQYAPYQPTTEAVIVGLGVVLLVLAVFVAALGYRAERRPSAAGRTSVSDSPGA
jgi:hypothetical protein